jgi:uncharacterized protein YdhG (YjbR/CyaY superfamily)
MDINISTIDDYIACFPQEVQTHLLQIRAAIKEAAPMAKEKISYRMPTYELNGNLIHFAAFKNHIGLYPGPEGIEAFKADLSAYKGAKGSVQFPLNQPIPLQLVKKITKFRVEQNLTKPKKK